ncbi:MAG TPA: carboxypeptidase-like regulatory domain-containing protein, partial [Flavobacteriaceae bacterium]
MIKKYFFLVLLIFGFSIDMNAQISGIVKDDSGPLPGVSIIIKGTTTGATTDFDGKYSINAQIGDVLVFSFVGYDTQELRISSNTLN